MKLVVWVKLLPTLVQAAALEATLSACNEAATWVSATAFEAKSTGNRALRARTYTTVKERWGLGAQAAQHAIKKTADAYTTLRANLTAGSYGRPGTRRYEKAAGKPVAFRPESAQPYDDRMLSWQHERRTVSIWTTAGRLKGVAFTGQAQQLEVVAQRRQGESDLIRTNGVWYLLATCEIAEAEMNTHPAGFVGVDLGIVNIATTSEGARHSGRRMNRRREADRRLRSKLQKKGTKSAKRRRGSTRARSSDGPATLTTRSVSASWRWHNAPVAASPWKTFRASASGYG